MIYCSQLKLDLLTYSTARVTWCVQDEAIGASSSSTTTPRTSPYRGRAAAGTDREISRDRLSAAGDESGESNGNGRIEFNIKYDAVESTLTLKVIRAVELPAKDFISGTSDPYVKIMLLPEKRSKMSTSIKRRNLNPRWNEIFAFEGDFALSSTFVGQAGREGRRSERKIKREKWFFSAVDNLYSS